MSINTNKPNFSTLRSGRRSRAVQVTEENLVTINPLHSDTPLPLVICPAVDDLNLNVWAENNRELIEKHLRNEGAVLFRGFGVNTSDKFQEVVGVFSNDLLDYTYGFTPRSRVSDKIYTSTEYPADQFILPHNEKSYDTSWPMRIWFCCVVPAKEGGETPIYDSRKVYERLEPSIGERFAREGVMYMRNYSRELDLPWQDVFQTTDKSQVEAFCREADVSFEWRDEDHLRTFQRCQAIATHPQTGEKLWFNQAHLFHVTSLPETIRETLMAEFEPEDLPRNVYYGDGAPIETAVFDEIRAAYETETIAFPWQEGDVLMLDNMLIAHGRNPFVGPRKIIVAMAGLYTREEMEGKDL